MDFVGHFIHQNEEIYIVMCNSHLEFSKSMKIYHLENFYTYGIYSVCVCPGKKSYKINLTKI